MRLPSFRVRTLLIAVAVVGMLLEGVRLRRWRANCSERARYHGEMGPYREWAADLIADVQRRRWRGHISSVTGFVLLDGTAVLVSSRTIQYRERVLFADKPGDRAAIDRLAEWCRREAAYHGRMRQEWERAATRPWLPAPSDSPPPPAPK